MNAIIEGVNLINLDDTNALAAIIEAITPTTADPVAAAKSLIDAFGSLKNVIEAPAEALKNYTTRSTANKIAALLPIFRLYIHRTANQPKQIANRADLETYCKTLLQGKRVEEFWVVCVNAQCRIVGSVKIAEGSLAEVASYPRKVMEAALNCNAHSVFITHNHPGGTCAPSQEDITTTLQLQRMLRTVDILLLDHMIIAGNNGYSLAQHGDIQFSR